MRTFLAEDQNLNVHAEVIDPMGRMSVMAMEGDTLMLLLSYSCQCIIGHVGGLFLSVHYGTCWRVREWLKLHLGWPWLGDDRLALHCCDRENDNLRVLGEMVNDII